MRVLVVDDDPGVRSMIELALKLEGFEVCVAADGTGALRVARDEVPDVIVLDVMMPEPDGFDVARQLRDETQFDDTAIVFCSALREEHDLWTGWSAGADSYVTKPFTSAELVAELLRVHQRRTGSGGAAVDEPALSTKGA